MDYLLGISSGIVIGVYLHKFYLDYQETKGMDGMIKELRKLAEEQQRHDRIANSIEAQKAVDDLLDETGFQVH